MNRTQKEEQVAGLRDKLATAPFLALADYRGVNVAEINHFRRTLEAKGIQYLVVKNTLARLAVQGTELEGVVENLSGMTGWIISGDDPIDAAKTLKSVIKELDFKKNEKFNVKTGYFDGAVQAQQKWRRWRTCRAKKSSWSCSFARFRKALVRWSAWYKRRLAIWSTYSRTTRTSWPRPNRVLATTGIFPELPF